MTPSARLMTKRSSGSSTSSPMSSSDTTIIHMRPRAQARDPLFTRVLHLVKAPAMRTLVHARRPLRIGRRPSTTNERYRRAARAARMSAALIGQGVRVAPHACRVASACRGDPCTALATPLHLSAVLALLHALAPRTGVRISPARHAKRPGASGDHARSCRAHPARVSGR